MITFSRCQAKAQQNVSFLPLLGNVSMNTFSLQRIHTTIEELLEAALSTRAVSYQGKLGSDFFQNSLFFSAVEKERTFAFTFLCM
jgi:hypothetical protein